MTQQNAAMVEEATAAAQSLASETDELARLIGEFKLVPTQGHAGQLQPATRREAPRAPHRRTTGKSSDRRPTVVVAS